MLAVIAFYHFDGVCVVADEVIDSENSIVIQQAHNRTYSAQLVLQKILKRLPNKTKSLEY